MGRQGIESRKFSRLHVKSCVFEVTFSGLAFAVTKVNYSRVFEKQRCNIDYAG